MFKNFFLDFPQQIFLYLQMIYSLSIQILLKELIDMSVEINSRKSHVSVCALS